MQNYDRDPIEHQIMGIGHRKLIGCVGRFFLALILGSLVIGFFVKHTEDKNLQAAMVFGITGFMIGVGTSILARNAKRILVIAFILMPILISLVMFAKATLFGQAEDYPITLVASPIAFTLGYLLGHIDWRKMRDLKPE